MQSAGRQTLRKVIDNSTTRNARNIATSRFPSDTITMQHVSMGYLTDVTHKM